MARSYVARQIIKLGGFPAYREGFVTDNGNVILDVFHLPLTHLLEMEQTINNIPGVVEKEFLRNVLQISYSSERMMELKHFNYEMEAAFLLYFNFSYFVNARIGIWLRTLLPTHSTRTTLCLEDAIF